jgi:hypothetical protein
MNNKTGNTMKVIEVVGTSDKSWEDAAVNAMKSADENIRNIVGLDLMNQTAKVENGEIVRYKSTVKIAFRVEQ